MNKEKCTMVAYCEAIAAANPEPVIITTVLQIPFEQKEFAKKAATELGVKLSWNKYSKVWVCEHEGELPTHFHKWADKRTLERRRIQKERGQRIT
jgi:hypothetical protein